MCEGQKEGREQGQDSVENRFLHVVSSYSEQLVKCGVETTLLLLQNEGHWGTRAWRLSQ